jgi:hypothetical protein
LGRGLNVPKVGKHIPISMFSVNSVQTERLPAVDDFLARQLLTLAYTINHPGGNGVALASNHSSCAAHTINHPSCAAATYPSGAFQSINHPLSDTPEETSLNNLNEPVNFSFNF